MGFRFIHTSDWHLGATMRDGSLEEEQLRFLRWLLDELSQRDVDALVVAGDLFHHRNPSNRARQLYYDFLAACEKRTTLKQVIVTAGNHDSPSGLEAPRALLEYLRVKVLGTLRAEEKSWTELLVPVKGTDGEICGVVAAVPYVSEARLGISGLGKNHEEIKAEFQDQFQKLYRVLADEAQARYGDLPLVATGHLTCYGQGEKKEGDFHTPIHQIGTIEALPPQIFDSRFDYVALGHIHRMFPIYVSGEEPRIWYSGTPVPTAVTERSQRYVLEVQIDAPNATPVVEKIKVPAFRDVLLLEGSTDEVLEAARTLTTEKELKPYLFVRLQNEELNYRSETYGQIKEALFAKFSEEMMPRVVDFRNTLIRPASEVEEALESRDLEEITPEELFADLYRYRFGGTEVPDEILQAFRELLGGPEEKEELRDEKFLEEKSQPSLFSILEGEE